MFLRTRSEGTYFKMERRVREGEDAFYQTAYQSTKSGVQSRTEQIDLVIGSGRKGQSYLYWKNGLLFQLPVSFLVERGGWANSPGYVDGEVNFDRLIPPRCLECHATSFNLEGALPTVRYSRDYELGISCQNCHGDGSQHVEYHAGHPGETEGKYILSPARFSRERKLDNCALCHSGMRGLKRPPFSYKPGEKLEDFLMPATGETNPIPEVHGNQVGLLELSKCFRSSPAMSCSSCHNVHQREKDLTQLAQRCLQCHQVKQCKQAGKTGVQPIEQCLDCHMPNQGSKLIRIDTATTKYPVPYRNHMIGIYPDRQIKRYWGSFPGVSQRCAPEVYSGSVGARQATGRLRLFSRWSDSNVQTINECAYGRARSANFPACQHSRTIVPGN